MDSYVELAKMIKGGNEGSSNIFLGEVISASPLKIRVNGNDLTSSNMLIADHISYIETGQKMVVLKYNSRLYLIIARV